MVLMALRSCRAESAGPDLNGRRPPMSAMQRCRGSRSTGFRSLPCRYGTRSWPSPLALSVVFCCRLRRKEDRMRLEIKRLARPPGLLDLLIGRGEIGERHRDGDDFLVQVLEGDLELLA